MASNFVFILSIRPFYVFPNTLNILFNKRTVQYKLLCDKRTIPYNKVMNVPIRIICGEDAIDILIYLFTFLFMAYVKLIK